MPETDVDLDVELALARVTSVLERELDSLTDAATEAVFTKLPAYAQAADARLRANVRSHVREHMANSIAILMSGAEPTLEDFLFIRRYAVGRVRQVRIADFVGAFHVGQQTLWNRAVELGDDDVSRRAVMLIVPQLLRYFEVATVHAAEIYVEAEQLLATTAERLRRDVLDDLLRGVVPASGPGQELLAGAGLRSGRACMVLSAVPAGGDSGLHSVDEHELRGAAAALGRAFAFAQATAPLAVLRHQEIVLVAPVPVLDAPALAAATERLEAAQQSLARRGLALAVGTSTVHAELAGVADAYGEAGVARERCPDGGGVVALATMTLLDYVTLAPDPTARRLVSPDVQRFVSEDLASGGALVATVEAYAAADLNVKECAKALHVHVNTAHYRLARVAERTGTDLRKINDVLTLVIAARLSAHDDSAAA